MHYREGERAAGQNVMVVIEKFTVECNTVGMYRVRAWVVRSRVLWML